MRFLSSIRIVRVTLALAVALWMAGAGCMLGCENMVSAAALNEAESSANSPTVVADGGACASMHSHDCCARRGEHAAHSVTSPVAAIASQPAAKPKTLGATFANAVVVELGGASSTRMDCPLAVNATAALSKARPDKASTALPLTRASFHLPELQEQANALSPPLLLPNRGHTYLRCCVFLI